MIKCVAIFAIIPLAACAVAPMPSPGEASARIGQAALLGGVQVHPLSLLEDSRCPALVRCIWAGRLRIEAAIQFHGGSEELRREMTLGQAISLPEGELTLAAAVPAPITGKVRPASAYRFTFKLKI